MTRRDSWIVPVLTLVTCGIYYFIWQYTTTEELKTVSGREDLNPVLDLIITILCCGLYGIYVQYRNAQVIHEVMARSGVPHEDKSNIILIMHALHAFTGVTGLIGLMIAQDEINKLADGGRPATF